MVAAIVTRSEVRMSLAQTTDSYIYSDLKNEIKQGGGSKTLVDTIPSRTEPPERTTHMFTARYSTSYSADQASISHYSPSYSPSSAARSAARYSRRARSYPLYSSSPPLWRGHEVDGANGVKRAGGCSGRSVALRFFVEGRAR